MSSENPLFNDGDATQHLTKDERWLYRFCQAESVSGISGPKSSVQDLLRTCSYLAAARGEERQGVTARYKGP